MKTFSKFLLLLIFLMSFRTYAQWITLPDAPSPFTASENCSFGTAYLPSYVIPFDDGKILYTASCSRVHFNQIYGLISENDFVSGHLFYNHIESYGYTTFGNVTSAGAGELSCYVNENGNVQQYYTNNYFDSKIEIAGGTSGGIATAITTNYVYGLFAAGSTTYILKRSDKLGNVFGTKNETQFVPYLDKLRFLNDSLGFMLAKYHSNLSKTTLLRINGYEAASQPLLTDSLDPIIDYSVLPGNLFVLKQSGLLLRSADNGATFSALSSIPTSTYTCIRFANPLVGFIGGLNGVLLRTLDGGNTWTNEVSNTTEKIEGMYTFNSSSYFVSTSGKVFKSEQPLGLGPEERLDFKFSVSPNPCMHEVTIEAVTGRELRLELTDGIGKKMLVRDFSSKVILDVSTLAEGLYFVKLMDLNKVIKTSKLLVVK